MKKRIAAALACATAGLAGAQQAGTYQGHTGDGHDVFIGVQFDENSNRLYVQRLTSYFTLHCAKTAEDQDWGLDLYGDLGTINGTHVEVTYDDGRMYLTATLDFTADGKVAGRTRGALPEFSTSGMLPKTAQVCGSDSMKYSAKFVGVMADSEAPPFPGAQGQARRAGAASR